MSTELIWVSNLFRYSPMKSKYLPLLLACLGIILRVIPVWSQLTWYDENFTILLSRLPLDRLLAATAGDVHPPLFYLLCWPLGHIPGVPGWLVVRLPSVLASIATLWVWWQILHAMQTSPRVRMIAFGLFCILPQQIYYAQEGRMYALLTLLVLCAWLCILQRRWVWLALVTALMLYSHNYALFFCAALWLAALVRDRSSWRSLTISMACAGLAYIPWMVVLIHQMSLIHGNYWIVSVTLPSVLRDLAHTVYGVISPASEMVIIAVFYGVLIWTLISALRRRALDLSVVILAILPCVLAALVSVVWQPIMLTRALIPSGVFVLLLVVDEIAVLKFRPLLLMSICVLPALLSNLMGAITRSQWVDTVVESTMTMYAIIDDQWQPGDLVYYADGGLFISGTPYWHNVDNLLAVEMCGPVRGGLTVETWAALGIDSGPLPENVEGRIWVVTADSPFNPPCEGDYLRSKGLLNGSPLMCGQDNAIVKSCLYLVDG
jgi:hypothetical protein